MKGKLVYIAGPYTAPTREGVQRNIDAAEAVGKKMLKLGAVPVIPHRITGHWDVDPTLQHISHSEWMLNFCIPLLSRCDVLVAIEGWDESPGTMQEIEHAHATGIAVYLLCGSVMVHVAPTDI